MPRRKFLSTLVANGCMGSNNRLKVRRKARRKGVKVRVRILFLMTLRKNREGGCNRSLVPRQLAAYICCTRRRFRISPATSSALFLPCRRALLPTCDLLTFVTCAVLVGRCYDQVKTRSQKLQ